MAVNLRQAHFRFGINELAESTHGWHAALDTNPAEGVIAVDTTFLLRFTVQETGGTAAGNTDQQFQCRKNAGAFQNITTSSTIVKAVTTAVFANGADLTKRLTGTGTFESSGDGGTHDGLSGGPQNDIAASGNSETECALQIVGADVVGGDVLEFRLTSPDFTITNDVVPTLTVSIPLTPTRGLASWSEIETPLVGTKARLSFAEGETPTVTTRARLSHLELEAPFVSTKARLSVAELEAPLVLTRGLLSYAEKETPFVVTRGRLSFAEAETPIAPTRGYVAWAECGTPSPPADPTRGLWSYTELETPIAPTRGLIGWGEFALPLVSTRGRYAWAEAESPFVATRSHTSWAVFELPALPTRGLMSWAETEAPDTLTATMGLISHAEFSVAVANSEASCFITMKGFVNRRGHR